MTQTARARERPEAAAPPRSLGAVLAATSLAMFMVQLDFFALNLALPQMAIDLGTSTADLQFVISGYMLALAAFLIPGGRLGDILGRRRMLIVGVATFTAASVVCGAATSPELIIGMRILQGIGAAIMFPLTVAIITNAFPDHRRARAIGNLYGLAAVATAIGPFVGGSFTSALSSWRSCSSSSPSSGGCERRSSTSSCSGTPPTSW